MIQVYQIKNGEILAKHDSISQAADSVGVNESSIRRALNKENRTVCSYQWVTEEKEPVYKGPPYSKILILDIETAPLNTFVWGLWKQNVATSQIVSDWFILTWAAKWLGDEVVYSERLTSKEAIEQDDSRIMGELWQLLDEADIVVAHNGDKFDIARIKTRFLIHRFVPPSPYKQIDTLLVARKEFGFSSNKLGYLAELLGHETKTKTTMELWTGSYSGKTEALKEMEEYNIQDIYVLENVYLSLRPYIKGHPNLDLHVDSEVPSCPSCGEHNLKEIPFKYFYTQAVKYKTYRCFCCGSICRAKKGEKYENKKSVSAIPR